MAERADAPPGRVTDIEDMVDALVAGVEPGESVDKGSLSVLAEAIDELTTDAFDEAFADVDAAFRMAVVTPVAGFGIVAALATAAAVSGR